MYDPFIKEFMIYDQKIRFVVAVKKMLKLKYYFYLIAQILTFVLLIIPQLLMITNWLLYNIIGFIFFLPTVAAFTIEAYLIDFAFNYYYIFPRLTDNEKDAFREYYYVVNNSALKEIKSKELIESSVIRYKNDIKEHLMTLKDDYWNLIKLIDKYEDAIKYMNLYNADGYLHEINKLRKSFEYIKVDKLSEIECNSLKEK